MRQINVILSHVNDVLIIDRHSLSSIVIIFRMSPVEVFLATGNAVGRLYDVLADRYDCSPVDSATDSPTSSK